MFNFIKKYLHRPEQHIHLHIDGTINVKTIPQKKIEKREPGSQSGCSTYFTSEEATSGDATKFDPIRDIGSIDIPEVDFGDED